MRSETGEQRTPEGMQNIRMEDLRQEHSQLDLTDRKATERHHNQIDKAMEERMDRRDVWEEKHAELSRDKSALERSLKEEMGAGFDCSQNAKMQNFEAELSDLETRLGNNGKELAQLDSMKQDVQRIEYKEDKLAVLESAVDVTTEVLIGVGGAAATILDGAMKEATGFSLLGDKSFHEFWDEVAPRQEIRGEEPTEGEDKGVRGAPEASRMGGFDSEEDDFADPEDDEFPVDEDEFSLEKNEEWKS